MWSVSALHNVRVSSYFVSLQKNPSFMQVTEMQFTAINRVIVSCINLEAPAILQKRK